MITTTAIGVRASRRADGYRPGVYIDIFALEMGGTNSLKISRQSALALSKALYAAAKFIEEGDDQFKQVVELVPIT